MGDNPKVIKSEKVVFPFLVDTQNYLFQELKIDEENNPDVKSFQLMSNYETNKFKVEYQSHYSKENMSK